MKLQVSRDEKFSSSSRPYSHMLNFIGMNQHHRTIAGRRERSHNKTLLAIQFCHGAQNLRLSLMLYHLGGVMQIG